VSVRLEGGLGDHILGMRVLSFARQRYPGHEIVAYSDSGGHEAPLQAASMSPFVSRVSAIYHTPGPMTTQSGAPFTDRMETICPQDLEEMTSADLFIDTLGRLMFARAAVLLDVPVFGILAHRPELSIPQQARQSADELLSGYDGAFFVAVNFGKPRSPRLYNALWRHVLELLLRDPTIVVLNVYTSRYAYPQWPDPERAFREHDALRDGEALDALCRVSDRVLPCVDLPISVVAALLERCKHFIGLDNGIKHLAWALGVPLTFFSHGRPMLHSLLRWMPDFHRMVSLSCAQNELDRRIGEVVSATPRWW
jgi:hypothetical protein